MGQLVCSGAQMMCTMGTAPSALNVLPIARVNGGGPPAANILDSKPLVNVPPFAMCMSLSNPTVASATSAASGVLTPMPCVPSIPAPWAPGSPTVLIGNQPALNNTSKTMCAFGGTISLVSPGQFTVQVP